MEAPLWRSERHIWFSDVIGNVLRSVTPDGEVEVLMRDASGKTNVPHGGYVGPKGMVGDKEGTVLMCEHTNRREMEAKARTAIPAFAACGQLDLRGRLHTALYSEIDPASASFAVRELS